MAMLEGEAFEPPYMAIEPPYMALEGEAFEAPYMAMPEKEVVLVVSPPGLESWVADFHPHPEGWGWTTYAPGVH